MNELQPIETTDSSLPAVPEGSNKWIQHIHAAKLALEQSSNDSERKEILDKAKQAENVAAALELTEIQVMAANLKIDCEVAIERANPPKDRGGDRRSDNFQLGTETPIETEQPIKPDTIRDLRKAYNKIEDEEIEEAKQVAIDNQVPLTRSYFREKSAEKKEAEAEVNQSRHRVVIPDMNPTEPYTLSDAHTEITVSPKANTMHTFGKQRNNTEEWYTPTDVIDRVRAVLGEIDLDPASNPVANEVVKAKQIYTKEDDGLAQEWHGKVFLNPPFGSETMSRFVEKLISEYQSGNVPEAIMLTDSLSLPNWFSKAIAACDAMFITTDRFYYWNDSNETQRGWSKGCLFYFGSNRQVFYDVFKDIGTILTRYEVVAC